MVGISKKIIISDLLTTDALVNSIRVIYILMFVGDENFIANLGFYLTASLFFFELPSGYFGDNFGNKKMVILSKLFFILAIVFLIIDKTRFSFMLSYIFLGIFSAFESGAKNSYFLSLFDNDTESYKALRVQIAKYKQAISFGFSILSSVLFYINMYIPFVITIILVVISLVLLVSLPKDTSTINKGDRIGIVESFRKIFIDILSNKRFAINIIYFTMMLTILIFTFYYYGTFFINNNIPEYLVGSIYATFSILSFIGVKIYQDKKLKKLAKFIKILFPLSFLFVTSNNLVLLFLGVILQEIVFSMLLIDFEINTISEMKNREDSSQFQSLVSFMYAVIRLITTSIITFVIGFTGFNQMFYIFTVVAILLIFVKIESNEQN